MIRDEDWSAFFRLIIIGDLTRYAECLSMEGGLWNQTVREGDAEKTGDTSGQTEKENIPMEPGRFAKRNSVPCAMRDDTAISSQ